MATDFADSAVMIDTSRILLIEPPFYRLFKATYSLNRYPLSLGYLAGTIKNKTNWSVVVYNADFSPESETIQLRYLTGQGFNNYLTNLRDPSKHIWREIKSTISEYEPTVVGVSVKSQNLASAHIIARLAKETNNQTIVLVGGPHPSMVGADVLSCPDIDIAVRGEGEDTIVDLLDAIDSHKQLDAVRGIVYREEERVVENAPRPLIADLDSLCFPHETAEEVLKDHNQYPRTAFKYIFAIRGCPYDCFFCGSRYIWTRKVRFRSPDNVAREIRRLQLRGLKSVHFDDDTFGVSKEYIRKLCNALIRECPGIRWSCELHVNLVNQETLSLMKAAGCRKIQIGIESGNDKILKAMRKNTTLERAISASKAIKKHGMELEVFFMVGFPQETEETLNDTKAAMKRIGSDTLISYSIFTPYPGTEAFEFCRQKGLIDNDFDVSLHNHQSPESCFCTNITKDKFRALVSGIERMVDRKNKLNRMKLVFSLNTFWRIQELGLRRSLRAGIRVLCEK